MLTANCTAVKRMAHSICTLTWILFRQKTCSEYSCQCSSSNKSMTSASTSKQPKYPGCSSTIWNTKWSWTSSTWSSTRNTSVRTLSSSCKWTRTNGCSRPSRNWKSGDGRIWSNSTSNRASLIIIHSKLLWYKCWSSAMSCRNWRQIKMI